jgi:AraC family transcriptional regulator
MEYEVTEVPDATYAVLRQTVEFGEVPQLIPAFIEQVGAWAREAGAITGPPASITSMTGDGRLNVASGWAVDGSRSPPEPIELAVLPGGRAAVYVHVGPYDTLPDVYQELGAALANAGLQPGAAPREIYESDPDEVPDPQQYVTRIIWPLD